MMTVVLAIALGVGGIFAAAIWTFVVGLMGAPGAMLHHAAEAKSNTAWLRAACVFLTMAGQLLGLLIFTAAVVGSTRSLVEMTDSLGWLLWFVAFSVSGSPGWMMIKDASRAERRNAQQVATGLSVPLGNLTFFWFAFFPESADVVFGWVPHL